jgi:hypothetical protein
LAGAIEEIAKSVSKGGLPTSLATAIVGPVVIQVAWAGIRPLARGLIKGGVVVAGEGRRLLMETGERLSDLVAEARGEDR